MGVRRQPPRLVQQWQNMQISGIVELYLACLHDQNKSGLFTGPAFFHLMRDL